MKRIAAVLLALIFTVSSTTGCIPDFLKKSTSPLSSDDAKSIETIFDLVEESEELFDEIKSVEKYQKQIAKIKNADAEGVTLTVDASKEYFQRLSSCLNDLHSVMAFELDESAAFAPDLAYDIDSYGDDFLASVEGMHASIEETIANCQSIETCPAYMQETFNILIEKISIYRKMLETMYIGYNLEDPLRICSADQLYERQNIEISNCETLEKSNCGVSEITYFYLTMKPEISIDYEIVDTIYSSLYSSLDFVINLTETSENGDTEVIIQAEIPGFTQAYQQKVTITEQVTKLLIKPVIIAADLDLSRSKDAQIRFSVTDAESGKIITEESKAISLMSVYDFALTDDAFGITSRDNILAWLTPESEGILALRRRAISWLEAQTGGQVSSLIGYQDYGIFEDYRANTYLQILALQAAISDMGVRYNMGAFSLAKGENQRVLMPDDILSSQSGICIETAILFATDDESAALTTEKTNEKWASYLADPWADGCGTVYVVDCDLVKTLGIQCIDYNYSSENSTNTGTDTTSSTITTTPTEPI